MNYYSHHIGDYARDTAHLSMLEDAAYRRMLDLYYASERPLPDGAPLYRLLRARSKPEIAAVKLILGEFFHHQEDGWHNKRADAEIEKWQAKAGKAKASAELRWQSERNANASANAQQDEMRTLCDGNANQEPRTKNQEPEANNQKPEKKPRKRETLIPDGFSISDRVKNWAEEKGHAGLERYLEFFVGRMRANGKKYLDWDEAFMNCIREDWPGLHKGNGSQAPSDQVICRRCKHPIAPGDSWVMTNEGRVHGQC